MKPTVKKLNLEGENIFRMGKELRLKRIKKILCGKKKYRKICGQIWTKKGKLSAKIGGNDREISVKGRETSGAYSPPPMYVGGVYG